MWLGAFAVLDADTVAIGFCETDVAVAQAAGLIGDRGDYRFG